MTDNTKTRMTELDGLRAIAILWVVSFHSWYSLQIFTVSAEAFLVSSDALPWFSNLFRRGDLGVDIFFVLSGYLLSWQMFSRRIRTGKIGIKRFYFHRLFRIYPLYLTVLFLALLSPEVDWKTIAGNIFAYNIWFDPLDLFIPWTWSLSVELEFYLIVPFLILLIKDGRSLVILLVLAVLLTIGWSCWILVENPKLTTHTLIELRLENLKEETDQFLANLYFAMPVRISQFVMGITGAWLVLNRREYLSSIRPITRLLLVMAIIFGIAMPLLHNPFTHLSNTYRPILIADFTFGRITFAISIALIIVLMQVNQLPRLKNILSAAFLEPIARFSFSMYIFHPVFVYLGAYIFVSTGKAESYSFLQLLGVYGVAIFTSVIFGFITWYTIERPAIRFGKKMFG